MTTMKLNLLFLPAILTVFTSCNRQNISKEGNSPSICQNSSLAFSGTKGELVNELAKNSMVVYQDKKNHYWFGSWEDGLYRDDGKSILHFTMKDGLSHHRVDEILEDKFGSPYFNTSGGINKFDGQHFTCLSIANLSKEGWKLAHVDLWFRCTNDAGQAYHYDGKSLYL